MAAVANTRSVTCRELPLCHAGLAVEEGSPSCLQGQGPAEALEPQKPFFWVSLLVGTSLTPASPH